MRLSSVSQNSFVLNGVCPFCSARAAFPSVSQVYEEPRDGLDERWVAASKCIACNRYILAIIKKEYSGSYTNGWQYEIHYPMGTANDAVAEEIPDDIKPDLKEALRCRYVNAYNATVQMCRRALEASCLEQGADEKLGTLQKMVDWMHSQGKITTALKEQAHKIRLGGDRGAHPSERIIDPNDADAVIEFTKDFFNDIYVMPKRMEKFNFDKPKKK